MNEMYAYFVDCFICKYSFIDYGHINLNILDKHLCKCPRCNANGQHIVRSSQPLPEVKDGENTSTNLNTFEQS